MEESDDDILQRRLRHLKVTRDPARCAVWMEFKFSGRPCFTTDLLNELAIAQHSIRQTAQQQHQLGKADRLQFQVLASTDTRAFSLGGDLTHFIDLIERRDSNALLDYARSCIDIQFASVTHYDIPFTTIALVQGEALGGGFEAALSNNVIIAEESSRFGFPELSFGMFPGMGAISLLTRKITPAMARRLIMDRRAHTAEELYDMGVIDVLVADGEGREAVASYMQRHSSIAPGLHGFQAAVDRAMPVKYDELYDIVEHWVDTALQLSKKNRRLMAYFARAQSRQERSQHPPLTFDRRHPSHS